MDNSPWYIHNLVFHTGTAFRVLDPFDPSYMDRYHFHPSYIDIPLLPYRDIYHPLHRDIWHRLPFVWGMYPYHMAGMLLHLDDNIDMAF
jgi:hypothetical protein